MTRASILAPKNRFSHHNRSSNSRKSTVSSTRKSTVSFKDAVPEEKSDEESTTGIDDTSRIFDHEDSDRFTQSEMTFRLSTTRKSYRKNKERVKESLASGDDSANFPADCYSFISVYGPTDWYFWIGLMVFGFQMVFLGLALLSITNSNWRTGKVDDNPGDGALAGLFATEAGPILRTTQFMSLITSIIFVDSSVDDILTAVHTFPRFSLAVAKKDRVWCMAVSCVLRLIQGFFALFVSVFLVFNSNNVIDVILNFTALNFISALDDLFFDFCKTGKYGCTVVYFQEHDTIWETIQFRVQFNDEAFQKFNGCYDKSLERLDSVWKRDFYTLSHGGKNTENTNNEKSTEISNPEFGFCHKNSRWLLYEGHENDPCEVEETKILVSSSYTDSFDISTSFRSDWFTAKGIPVDLYFTDNDEQLFCDEFVDDGICNDHFNDESYGFDGGDCCATTCSHEGCGVKDLTTAFGVDDSPGDGFPFCEDPSMVPLIIELNNFTNNRQLYNTAEDPLSPSDRSHVETFRPDFWNVTPADALLTLYCNDVKILKVYINPNMINGTEKVMVPEEAKCEIRITNSTSTVTHFDDDPLWYVDYTVYNGGDKKVILVEENSFRRQSVSFERIPNCYKDKLEDANDQLYGSDSVFFDGKTFNLYKNLTAAAKAVLWMVDVTETKDKVCPEDFRQRYALASMYYSAPTSEPWIQKDAPCNWPHIICVGAFDSSYTNTEDDIDLLNLDLAAVGLSGTIPPEIGLMENLALYDISDNPELKGTIPTEIRFLTNLTTLKIEKNSLSGTIPTEIGELEMLTRLHLTSNNWNGTIPTEIGKLINLKSLRILDIKELSGTIPTEIGLLTALTSLRIGNCPNLTSSIPSEIGELTDLKLLTFKNNFLTGSIPKDIGSLTKLTRLRLDENPLTGAIPSELGSLTSLTSLNIDKTALTGSFPTFSNNFTNFRVVYMDNIDAIPTESLPDSLQPLIAKNCNICENYQFINPKDGKNISITCVKSVEDWEYFGNRATEKECSDIQNNCIVCMDGTSNAQNGEHVGSPLPDGLDPAALRLISIP